MKISLHFLLVAATLSAPLTGCGPHAHRATVISNDFASAAFQVLGKIERAHLHGLNIGEETPEAALNRLDSYANSAAEKDVVEKLNNLLIIMYTRSDEYTSCDTKIRTALYSRVWPNTFYPECK